MRILYVFAHPGDETLGPAPALARQVRAGHEVHLLTLTRGGASRARHKLGYSVEQMGEARLAELRDVAATLGLASLMVPDLPDGGLDGLDPRSIVKPIGDSIRRVRPGVLVTHAVHGVTGHPDHAVVHAVVKQAFCQTIGPGAPWLGRLAFWTLTLDQAREAALAGVGAAWIGSELGAIDCVEQASEEDMAAARRALGHLVLERDKIERLGLRERMPSLVAFEIFQESCRPPRADLTDGLPGLPRGA